MCNGVPQMYSFNVIIIIIITFLFQMYRNLVEPPFPDTEYGCYMAESNKMYEKALEMFPAPEPPDE